MKKLSLLLLISVLLFSMCSCSLWYDHENNAIGCFDVGYAEFTKDAFVASYNWDGSNEGMNIVVPEVYNDIKISGMGGYFGRGVPTPFIIHFSDEARAKFCPSATGWFYASHTANIENANVQYLPFQLHISKNIKEAVNLCMGGIIVAERVENEEEICKVYVLTCYVTCDEENKTFYSEDGKLYYRKNNVLVEDIVYYDFDLEEHNKNNKDNYAVYSYC